MINEDEEARERKMATFDFNTQQQVVGVVLMQAKF
jgi:hypothetical protein